MKKVNVIAFQLFISLLFVMCLPILSMGDEAGLANLSGKILINIQIGKKFYEYQLDFASNTFDKTCEQDIRKREIDWLKYHIAESESFLEARKRLKRDTSRLLESATDLFNKDEMLSIGSAYMSSDFGRCQTNSVQKIKPLTDKILIDVVSRSLGDIRIIPNKQSSYAIVNKKYDFGSSIVIVNILKKEIITPLCQESVVARLVSWSPDGRFVAYVTDKIADRRHGILVIYDVDKNKVVLNRNLVEYTPSIAWNQSSTAVAVLTEKTDLSFNPFNCCCLMPAGHPASNYSFSLQIYDFQREIKTINDFLKINFDRAGQHTVLWE